MMNQKKQNHLILSLEQV